MQERDLMSPVVAKLQSLVFKSHILIILKTQETGI